MEVGRAQAAAERLGRAGVFFRAASKATDRADTERAMNGEKKVPRRSWRASPPRARVGGAADPGPEGDAAGPPPAAGHAQGEAPGKPPSTAKKSLRAMLHFGGGSSGKRKANFLPQQTGAVSADAKRSWRAEMGTGAEDRPPRRPAVFSFGVLSPPADATKASLTPGGGVAFRFAGTGSGRIDNQLPGVLRLREIGCKLDPNDRAGGSVSYLQQGSEDDPHDSQQSETGLQQGQRDGGKLAPDERPGEGRTPMNGPTELSREPSEEPSELSREPNRGGSVMSKPRSTLGQLAGADTAFAHANVRMQSSFSQDFGAGLPNGPVTLSTFA
ncbi:MAG: hypothetical protein BJ554DRAFT_4525 [Olpidium bornovanus]|uniref:Uncharacterized protein n=1 Tax=Olpidium bornovanus TaxID=278681 RepID=A0A8H7ZM06_9FUNG|nr:MAG: hypothetical protein BJ554DRAFT_4525 [Olpidium bornovanus]